MVEELGVGDARDLVLRQVDFIQVPQLLHLCSEVGISQLTVRTDQRLLLEGAYLCVVEQPADVAGPSPVLRIGDTAPANDGALLQAGQIVDASGQPAVIDGASAGEATPHRFFKSAAGWVCWALVASGVASTAEKE